MIITIHIDKIPEDFQNSALSISTVAKKLTATLADSGFIIKSEGAYTFNFRQYGNKCVFQIKQKSLKFIL